MSKLEAMQALSDATERYDVARGGWYKALRDAVLAGNTWAEVTELGIELEEIERAFREIARLRSVHERLEAA